MAQKYNAGVEPQTDQPLPRRPRSASIDRDILGTLDGTPPPTNGHHSYAEDTPTQSRYTSQGKGKRRAQPGSDIEPVKVKAENDQVMRKRKFDDVEDLISDAASSVIAPPKKKGGRQKKAPQGTESLKPPPKRRKGKGAPASGTASKLPSEEPQQPYIHPLPHPSRGTPSVAGSIIGPSHDVTPMASLPSSPNLTAVSMQGTAPGFWPLDEPIPPLKKPKKLDPTQAAKRVVALEEAQRRVWVNIARKDVVKVCSDYLLLFFLT